MYSAFLHRFFGTRRRAGVVVLLWVLLVGLLAGIAPSLDDVENNDAANDPPATSASMRAADLAADLFPSDEGTPAIVVVDSAGAADTRAAVDRIATRIADSRADDPAISAVITADRGGADMRTADGTSEMIVVPLAGSPSDKAFQQTVDDLRTIAADEAGPAAVAVTGPAGIATDTVKVFSGGDKVLLLGTILLVVVLLMLIYRSPVLVVVALAGVGIAMRLAQTLGAMMADLGWFDISSQTASIMTVLLFGVGTDYALIVTARYREALATEPDRSAAMVQALRGVGESIVSSVSTIVLAMLALTVAVTPALRGFGPYLALGVASMALVAFTFTPALMVLLGGKLFWPSSIQKATERKDGKVWGRLAVAVQRSPKAILAATLAALVVMSMGLLGYRESFDFISGFRIDTESETGQQLIGDTFGPGEIAPATVYVTQSGGTVSPAQWSSIRDQLSDVDGIARVGDRERISTDGRAAAFEVAFTDNPYSPKALDRIEPLTATTTAIATDAGLAGAEVLIGGESARAADTRAALDRDMKVVVALVLIIVTGVLVLLLRSLLAPLYLVATLILSFTATLGITTFLTVTMLGDEGIGNRVAAYIFVFLVALGVDYNIFIMSRYRQELADHPPAEAMRIALTRTGGVISSAGLILAATFAVLMTQPIRELFQFGLAMAIGILLDTFVVRPLLVPAIIHLLGDKALWPARPPHPQPTESRTPELV
ncbi:MMPL family transporter [Rhodococcus hoagii]|nr:MMPL family transporter [Prescottella equi]